MSQVSSSLWEATKFINGRVRNHLFQPAERRTNFYSMLSTDKRQDSGTVAENIRMMLYDLFDKKELKSATLKVIISLVDGCAAQYRSGSVCYELCQLAMEFGIVYDRIIQASGHGKCVVDAMNGIDKTLLDMFFNCLVAHPEELQDGVKRVLTHDKDEDGVLVSLADVCYEILNDPDRKNGARSNAHRSKNRKIDERRCFKRKEGAASGDGLKYVCMGFAPGEYNGLRSHYNIRADPELLGREKPLVIAMRRFPCCCEGCLVKLQEPIETRYSGPSNACIYWEVFKMTCGTKGYNDWKLVTLAPKKKVFKEEHRLARLDVTMNGVGKRMASQVKVGGFGAYVVDDERYDYYIVRWLESPKEATTDLLFEIEGEEFAVKKGEMYCKGMWLYKVESTTNWWKMTTQQCVVRMQVVVDADLDILPLSDENQLRRNIGIRILDDIPRAEAWWIPNDNHAFLREEANRRAAFDFEETFCSSAFENEECGDEEQKDFCG